MTGAIRSSATSRGARHGPVPLAAAGLVALAAARLSGQAPASYPGAAVDNARYHEQLVSDVVSRSGNAAVHRVVRREAAYAVFRQGDTVVVSADSLQVMAVTGADTTRLDTSGFIGGRWRLLLISDGRARVLERPFVPGALGEVNDLGAAMDDFFPRRPPELAVGATVSDLSGTEWRRVADSGAVRRYRWTRPADVRLDSRRRRQHADPAAPGVHRNRQRCLAAGDGSVGMGPAHRQHDLDEGEQPDDHGERHGADPRAAGAVSRPGAAASPRVGG